MVFRFNRTGKSWKSAQVRNEYFKYVCGNAYLSSKLFENYIGKKLKSIQYELTHNDIEKMLTIPVSDLYRIRGAAIPVKAIRNILDGFGLLGRAIANNISLFVTDRYYDRCVLYNEDEAYSQPIGGKMCLLKDVPDDNALIGYFNLDDVLNGYIDIDDIVKDMVSIYRQDFADMKLKETIIHLFDDMIKPCFKTGKKKNTTYYNAFMRGITHRINLAILNKDFDQFIYIKTNSGEYINHIFSDLQSYYDHIEDIDKATNALMYIINFCSRNIK